MLNVNTLIDAGMVAMVAGMSFIAAPREVVAAYRIAAHFGVLMLQWPSSRCCRWPSAVMLLWAATGWRALPCEELPDELGVTTLSSPRTCRSLGLPSGTYWASQLRRLRRRCSICRAPLAGLHRARGRGVVPVRPRQVALAYLLGAPSVVGLVLARLRCPGGQQRLHHIAWSAYAIVLLVVGLGPAVVTCPSCTRAAPRCCS